MSIDARRVLREIEQELDSELADVESQLSDATKSVTLIDSRAMAAIKQGEDQLAHQELNGFGAITEEIGKLDADAHVLRCLLTEIREFLDRHASTEAAPDNI